MPTLFLHCGISAASAFLMRMVRNNYELEIVNDELFRVLCDEFLLQDI